MYWKLLFLMVSFFSAQALAQTIEINGRLIRLQEKPDLPYRTESRNSLDRIDRLGLPDDINLSVTQTPIKDQGNRGSCAYFTTIALFEHALKRHHPEHQDVNLSEEYLIYANKALDQINTQVDGSFLKWNIRTLLARGMMLEEAMHYTHSWFDQGMPCATFADDETAPAYCRSHYPPQPAALETLIDPQAYEFQIDRYTTSREILQQLAEGQAVTVSIPVNQNGWKSDLILHNDQLEAECDSNPKVCGGHTVLLTGYNLQDKVFYFKNSWGPGWGVSGYGRMPFEVLQNWSYGDFHTARVKRLDRELRNQPISPVLQSVQVTTRPGVDSQGQPGIFVSLQFEYLAPLGSFFYVSLFPQIKDVPTETEPSAEPVYQAVYMTQDDGSRKILADRRFVLIQSPSDLIYGADRPFELFISQADMEKAGVWGAAELYLRPSIYMMNDYESYQVLFREYLTLPLDPFVPKPGVVEPTVITTRRFQGESSARRALNF